MGALVCMILSSLGGLMAHPLKVLFLPAVRTHWGEGIIQIRVTGNPIFSTLNGQTDNIFHGEPVILPLLAEFRLPEDITRKHFIFIHHTEIHSLHYIFQRKPNRINESSFRFAFQLVVQTGPLNKLSSFVWGSIATVQYQ